MTDSILFQMDPSVGSVKANERNQQVPPFRVGMQIFVDLVQRNKPVRATAHVMGWCRPCHLMTGFPEVQGRMVVASEESDVIIRFMHEGTIYGFPAVIVAKQQTPFPMWTLSHQPVVEFATMRRSPRIRIILPVFDETGREHVSVDISAHGMLLASKQTFSIGDRLTLSFALPDGIEVRGLRAEIVRLQQSREASLMAVNYFEDQRESLEKIAQYLYQADENRQNGVTESLVNRS
ncbi:MAG TPA: flagellar brake protein [bacterium]|nr:flagellar brake protein [bacterium]